MSGANEMCSIYDAVNALYCDKTVQGISQCMGWGLSQYSA